MDSERSLLSKAIHSRQLDALVHRGIEADHFADKECRDVFRMMVGHMAKYGEPPTEEAVRHAFPEFSVGVTAEATDYLIDRFVQQVKRRKAIDLYRDFGRACDDPERVQEIEVVAMEMASTLMDIVPSPRVGRYSEAEQRIQDYIREQALGIGRGMNTGFPTVDRYTVGLQPHELMVVAGWQNSGKSAIMQRIAWHFYSVEHKRPLYISLEMSKEECFGRWDSMANRIEHRALRAMELAEDDEAFMRWKEEARRAAEFRADRDILCIDDLGSCTPDRVLVECRRYEPDVCFVDYLELMDPPRYAEQEWQGINQIGRQLKRNARLEINGRHIPIVVGAQTNADDGGKGASLSSISYKSTGKHADIVVGIVRTEEMEREKRMELVGLKNRNGRRGWVQEVRFDPEYMDIGPAGADSFERRDEPKAEEEKPHGFRDYIQKAMASRNAA